MRPNAIHAVYTVKHAICHGGHFYSTSCLVDTLVSLIHGFICHYYINNTSHPETRILLRRHLYFFHHAFVQGLVEETGMCLNILAAYNLLKV